MIDSLVTEIVELQQQLTRKEAELTRIEETIRREQQQVRQFKCTCTYVCASPLTFPTACTLHIVWILFKTSLFFNLQVLQQELQSSEREKEMYRQQLMRKEAELTRTEETITKQQQQIQEMRQQVSLVTVALHVMCVMTRGPPDCR